MEDSSTRPSTSQILSVPTSKEEFIEAEHYWSSVTSISHISELLAYHGLKLSGEIDSDLDNVLNRSMASKASKHQRASQKEGRPSKMPKKTEVAPLASVPLYSSQVVKPTSDVRLRTTNEPVEARDAQLRLEDELKAAKLEVAARDAAIQKLSELESRLEVALKEAQKVPDLESTLEVTLKEVEAKNFEIKEIQELNAKLEEEKKMTFDVIEGEKARLLEEFKTKKDRAVDMVMYRIG
ncbi:uncharacterized protein LOC133814364 [Humulus lupulus]|uniref:uncharacterized protein LOC133814364 n=1 Tax=Humulus lupulus TaxID=3486 RepID=UPI002B417F25|nr:uncharacterized protein LOC133814364 [Humulus lupulus]